MCSIKQGGPKYHNAHCTVLNIASVFSSISAMRKASKLVYLIRVAEPEAKVNVSCCEVLLYRKQWFCEYNCKIGVVHNFAG